MSTPVDPLGLSLPASADPQAKLQQIANGFEEMFLRTVLKNARQVDYGGSEELFGSNDSDQYQSLLDEHLARDLAGQLGVAAAIVDQLRDHVASGASDQ